LPTFLESINFPATRVSEESAREKAGGGRPEFWEMVFWWTRKPLIGARCIIASALLDEKASPDDLYKIARLYPYSEKVPHRENPRVPQSLREKFKNVRLLDPFAGFGSIPLEAIRLGIGEVVAVEFLPTAYVFLKAVLEIPKWAVEKGLSEKLIKDVERWGEWVTERLREDPDVKELYDEDVAVYIGTWEVKCPLCNKYTPLIGNYWLARVKGPKGYKGLAWMEPIIVGDRVEIKVVDLNKELNSREISAKVSENVVETHKASYKVPEANIDARSELARCLHCNRVMPGKGDQWHVKRALREWNERLEKYLRGDVLLDELRASPARPRLLVKVKIVGDQLAFEPAVREDEEKLWKALEKLRQMWGDPDIPIEPLPPYGSRGMGGDLKTIIWGLDRWYKHFNPRQLLSLVKLVKLIRETGKRVEQEKVKEGLSEEEAFKYAEAITTYLAMILCKHADWNSMVSGWQLSYLIAAHTLAMRGIAMIWNWGEYNPLSDYRGTWKAMSENIIESLSYLVNAVSGGFSNVKVLLDDATSLSRPKEGDEKFDLVITDPPYRDDVPYTELSDFYYVWLKRALSDAEEGMLKPKFYPEAFFEKMDERGTSFVEVRTQWEKFAPLEISLNLGRAEFFKKVIGVEAGSEKDFIEKLGKAFKRMAELLKDDGLLITYYAHTDPSAWTALVEAGWRRAGLRVSAAYAIATESEQRVTARGKVALDASVVVVWRKGAGDVGLLHEVRRKALEEAVRKVEESIKAVESIRARGSALDINLFLRSLSAVLSVYTSYSKLVPEISSEELVTREVFPLALRGLVEGAHKYAKLEKPLDNYASAYLALKLVTRTVKEADEGARAKKRDKEVEEFRRGRVDRTFASLLGVFGGIGVEALIASKILAREKEELELLEPEPKALTPSEVVKALEVLLREKGVDPSKPELFRTSVDALHYLELKALQLTSDQFKKFFQELEARSPKVSEAVNLARALYSVLPKSDPEHYCCERVLSHLGLLHVGGFA
jgi:putative DNA methylase